MPAGLLDVAAFGAAAFAAGALAAGALPAPSLPFPFGVGPKPKASSCDASSSSASADSSCCSSPPPPRPPPPPPLLLLLLVLLLLLPFLFFPFCPRLLLADEPGVGSGDGSPIERRAFGDGSLPSSSVLVSPFAPPLPAEDGRGLFSADTPLPPSPARPPPPPAALPTRGAGAALPTASERAKPRAGTLIDGGRRVRVEERGRQRDLLVDAEGLRPLERTAARDLGRDVGDHLVDAARDAGDGAAARFTLPTIWPRRSNSVAPFPIIAETYRSTQRWASANERARSSS